MSEVVPGQRARSSACAIAAALCLAHAVQPVLAQSDTVVVTASRLPERAGSVVAEVSVIDRSQLDRASGRTLSEVLSQVPGLQFSSNGGLGKSASVYIRGMEARHTLLLLDGVRIGSATLGTPSLDNLPLDTIDRIEIVRGPMSSIYGADAAGGVIQIFTRRGQPGVQPVVRATVGSDRHGQFSGGVGFGQGAFDGNVQVQHTETRGASATNPSAAFGSYNADRDGFRQDGGSVRLGWQMAPGWRLEALALESNGRTGYDDGPGVDAQAGLHNSLQVLQAIGQVLPDWQTQLRLSRSTDAYTTLSSASAFATLGTIATAQRQLSWENRLRTSLGTVLAVAERLEQDVSRPGAAFDVSSRAINSLGLGLSGQRDGHSWQVSVRDDRNSQFGHQSTGALAYAYQWAPAWRAGLSHGTSFVTPSFNQLYYPGFGSPTLQPEKGDQTEAHVRWAEGAHSLRATAYASRIRGYITSGPLPTNVPRTRVEGLTLAYEGRWQGLVVNASIDDLNPRNVTSGSSTEGKQLRRRARQLAKLQADWTRGAWTLGGTLTAQGHSFEDAANSTRLGGWTSTDVRLDYAIERDWTVGLAVDNLADHRYSTALGYDQPRRRGFATLRWQPK